MSISLRSCSLNNYYLGVGILAFFLLVVEGYTLLAGNVIPYLQKGAGAGIPSDFQLYYEAAFRFSEHQESLYLEISRDSLWGYLYPPPSILLFLPFSDVSLGTAYLLFMTCSYGALVASLCIWFQYCEEKGVRTTYSEKAVLILVGTAAGSTYHNAMLGQVNPIVLLTCISYIFLLHRGRPAWAGLVLAVGIWIKLYPIMLCILGLKSRTGIVSILWTFFFGLAAVMLFLPWVTIDLYVTYFTDLLPRMSGRTIVNIINQSLTAFLMRFVIPLREALSHGGAALVVDTWVRWVNISFLAAWCVGAGLLMSNTRHHRQIVAASCLLAAIPMFSPLGWGHAYVFALPIILIVFHRYARNDREGRFARGAMLAALLALMIPVYHRFLAADALPSALQNLLYSRYFLLTLMCCVLEMNFLKMFSASQTEQSEVETCATSK